MYNQFTDQRAATRQEAPMDTSWKAGLEDVIAARSAVCAIDGAAGRLFYRGYEIGELAGGGAVRGGTPLLSSGGRARAAAAAGLPRRPPGPRRRAPPPEG